MRRRLALSMIITVLVLQVGACKRGEMRCPGESKLAGGKPPDASEEWCEYKDAEGNAVKHGTYIAWYPEGGKQAEVYYENGKENGPTTVWYPSGKKMLEGSLKDGERDGTWKRWFENGDPQLETEFSNGKRNGRDRRWDEKGEVLADFVWKDDKIVKTNVGPPPEQGAPGASDAPGAPPMPPPMPMAPNDGELEGGAE